MHLNGSNYLESVEHDFRIYNAALNREFQCFSVVPWLRQRLASFQNPSLQGMAGEKKARTRWAVRFCLFRRSRFTSAPCSFFELCPFCVAGVGRWGHFEVWNVVLHGRCRKLDTFSSVCMCGAFCTLLKRCNVGTRESKREMVLEVIFRGRRGIW